MNCEHIKSKKLINIINVYNITHIERQYRNVYKFYIFNGVITQNVDNFNITLQHYERIKQLIKNEQEKLLDTYVQNNYIWLKIKTKDEIIYDINIKGYNKIVNARHKFIDILEKNNHKLLSSYINAKEKVLIDFNCGHEPNYVTPNSYLNGTRCPICSNRIIKPYVNDCYTLRKDLLKYFINEKDAVGIGCSDRKQMLYKCPICQSKRLNTLSNIVSFGFSCFVCSDGISYSEKMMNAILKMANQKYDVHKYFSWCKYISSDDLKSHIGIYDFVIENKKLIIEMDGLFHKIDNYLSGQSKEMSNKIDIIKDNLAMQHGYRVVRIDCYYKTNSERFNYIKNNIILKLKHEIDLNNINWEEIEKSILNSIILDVCNEWNEGKCINDIACKFNLDYSTLRNYLKRGFKAGLCDYNKNEAYQRREQLTVMRNNKYIKVVNKENKVIGAFHDVNKFIDNFYTTNNIQLKKRRIIEILDTIHTTNNLLFKSILKEEYEELKLYRNIIVD